MTTLDHWNYAATGAAAAPPPAIIRITPTRKFIEKRFPTLGFTVDTGGLPFFEVLLATDRALFDPANAARRTPATFYASREHSGLVRGGDEPVVYVVPTGVIQRITGAREIFYTAACYSSAQGQDPSYAIPPLQLAREAPSVGIASDFQGRAMSASFAVPTDLLMRVREDDLHSSSAGADIPPATAAAYGDGDGDAYADREGGEDGYGLSAAIDYDDDYGPQMSGRAQSEEESPYAPDGEPLPPSTPGVEGGAALDYYDGYDEPIAARAQADGDGEEIGDEYAPASSQQSTYAAGSHAPSMLEDEDEQQRAAEGEYGESATYGDESDEEIPGAPEYQSLAAVPLTAREQRRIMNTVLSVAWPCGTYAAVLPATEPASAPAAGLSVGIVPFTQWSPALGELVKTMEARDAGSFHRIFGPKWKELRDSVTAKRPDRLKAVEGKELWREPWLERFKKAGQHKAFQAAQNETAAALFLQPLIPFAHELGLNSDRGLAMFAALTRRISFNDDFAAGAALQTVVDAVSPLKTDAQRQQALAAVGTAFQQAQRIDPAAKTWSNVQHSAVLGELRRSGRSPVPLPSRNEMLDLIVKNAPSFGGPAIASELAHLRTLGCLEDVEYAK